MTTCALCDGRFDDWDVVWTEPAKEGALPAGQAAGWLCRRCRRKVAKS